LKSLSKHSRLHRDPNSQSGSLFEGALALEPKKYKQQIERQKKKSMNKVSPHVRRRTNGNHMK
jgi:hypothetical protein